MPGLGGRINPRRVRSALEEAVAAQLARPTGLTGRVVALGLNRANRSLIRAAVDSLTLKPGDSAAKRFKGEVAKETLSLHETSMTDLPFAVGQLEGVMTVNTVYFLDDLAMLAGEVARILAPTGRFVVGIRDPDLMGRSSVTRHGFRIRPLEQVIAELRRGGLRPVEHRTHGSGPLSGHVIVTAGNDE